MSAAFGGGRRTHYSARVGRRADEPGTNERLENQRRRLDAQAERLERQHERLAAVEQQLGSLTTVYQVLEHQMASLEVRMDQLERAVVDDTPDSTDAERAEARGLVAEIREEHRRIRARFGVVARYEERLRRLEKVLDPQPDP